MLFSSEDLNKALQLDLGRTKTPTESSTSSHWAAWLLQQNLTKKYTDVSITKAAEQAAYEKLVVVNNKLLDWRPVSEPAAPQWTISDGFATVSHWHMKNLSYRIFERFRKLCHDQFIDGETGDPVITLAHAFNRGNVGPGASIGATDKNFVDKLFNSRLTCTHPILHKYYLQAIAGAKSWRKGERARAIIHGAPRTVKGNNLFFVPKETIIARTCCTEPTLNMFGQLGYGACLEDLLLKYHNIDLSTQQQINRWFARSGSLSGLYATIDLSSASDTIGLAFCEHYLPPKLMRDLKLLRSPSSRYKGKSIVLNMISTMGNGYTFPLQTWIFANLVLATFIETGEKVFDVYGKRRYAVNGDDIICPTGIYSIVTKVLAQAGFSVNSKKSYSTGGFRESCGGDYFHGVNVRAVYLKRCRNDGHVYGLINRLLDWTIRHGVALPHTISYLRKLVPFRPIPLYEDETAGIRTPISRLTLRTRDEYGNWIYHALEQNIPRIRPETRFLERFYHGFHTALLHGSFRGGVITPRIEEGDETYKVVKKSATMWWDFVPNARFTTEERRSAFELHFPIR